MLEYQKSHRRRTAKAGETKRHVAAWAGSVLAGSGVVWRVARLTFKTVSDPTARACHGSHSGANRDARRRGSRLDREAHRQKALDGANVGRRVIGHFCAGERR
jgi:hypothetical protein